MPQPTLLKLPKCILRVEEKLFRHPLKSQAPGCKRRRESIFIMDEDLMNPLPGSSTAFYIAFHPTVHGGPINPTCIAQQRPNSHHHDPRSAPQRSCHPRRMTVGPRKCEPHGFAKQMSVSFNQDMGFSMSSSWFSQVSLCWVCIVAGLCGAELLLRPFSRWRASFQTSVQWRASFQTSVTILLKTSQDVSEGINSRPTSSSNRNRSPKRWFLLLGSFDTLHERAVWSAATVAQRHSGVTAIASLVGFIYVGNVLESP